MVELILVSHSEALADATITLAKQMAADVVMHNAAGMDDADNPIGTDAMKILTALETIGEDGAVILVDLGSAILSTQTALDLCSPEIVEKVTILSAPFVEGAISAAVAAQGGATRDAVANEAITALKAKYHALGEAEPIANTVAKSPIVIPQDAQSQTITVANPHGLHARPAAKLATTLKPFQAILILEKDGQTADATRVNDIATLAVKQGEQLTLYASGSQSSEALAAFTQLAAENFGEITHQTVANETNNQTIRLPQKVRGSRQTIAQPLLPEIPAYADLEKAKARCQVILHAREMQAKTHLGTAIAEIFAAHQYFLDDLCEAANEQMKAETASLAQVWQTTCQTAVNKLLALDDVYLRARWEDIHDIAVEMTYLLADQPRPNPFSIADTNVIECEVIFPSQALALSAIPYMIEAHHGEVSSHTAQICEALGVIYRASNIYSLGQRNLLKI